MPADSATVTTRRWGEAGIGLGTIAFAGIAAWQASGIASEGVGSSVGPNVVPWIVSGMLALFGAALAIEALLSRAAPAPAEAGDVNEAIDWRSAGWMSLGLLLNVGLIEQAGFILASTLLFICTARAFGSTRLVRDAGIGFTLALIAYLGFDRLLGYKIGSGIVEALLP
jgi:putative tricarboxylic transport membrane protein